MFPPRFEDVGLPHSREVFVLASSRLSAELVPELGAGLGILALGGLGAGALLKRKYRENSAHQAK